MRPRLTYATQAWTPLKEEIKKLDSYWFGFLRRLVKGGYRKKSPEDPNNFSLCYTNDDLLRVTRSQPLRDFINTQYLKYIAHVCRRPNNNLTKLSLFITPKSRYFRDPWIKISKLLGDISIKQAKRETQSKTGFLRLLQLKYTPEELLLIET